jgi:hypothetical protein
VPRSWRRSRLYGANEGGTTSATSEARFGFGRRGPGSIGASRCYGNGRYGRPAALTPAASGQIAYISGNTLEVRNPETGQTTVDITQKTRITATVAVSLRAISVGACITVTGSKGKNGALDAATVTVAPTAGKCLAGGLRARVYGGGGHNPPPAFSGGTPRRRFSVPANFASAFGKVTSVSGSAIVIEGTMLSFASPRPGGTHPAAAPKPKKISVAVNAKPESTD